MPIRPDLLPNGLALGSQKDVLSAALEALRISGSLVLDHKYGAPWAINVPSSDQLALVAGVGPDVRVVAFHWAERGEFVLTTRNEKVAVGPGELCVCFGGLPHKLSRGRAKAIPLHKILDGSAEPPPGTDRSDATKLLCGLFILRDPAFNPLLGALPELLVASVLEDGVEPIARTLQRELREPANASSFIVERSLEALCASLVRRHLEATKSDAIGLFRALGDPRLSRALELVHRDPGAAWSVDSLAKRAGLSRSRFSARFTSLAGEGPMTYVTRWRMNVAMRLLRSGSLSVGEIGTRVGYESAPAFSRVFKRYLGVPPAGYRDGRRSQGD